MTTTIEQLQEFEKQLKESNNMPVDKAVTDLQEFEKQLKESNNMPVDKAVTDLQEFERKLKEGNSTAPEPQQPPLGSIRVVKSLIVSFMSDSSGTGHIRNIFPMMFLNSIFGKTGRCSPILSPVFIHQQDILARARSIFFQRAMSPDHLPIIENYKQHQPNLKYKMVWDMDDMIWGLNEEQGGSKQHGVPSYNFGAAGITKEVKTASVKIMNLMDVCTFSTQFLADYAKNVLKVTSNCVVLPNVIPKFFWERDRKPNITEKLKKPRVLYNGSPTHYHQERKMKGDFNNAWCDWVIKAVNEDKIHFIVMGGLPFFFEGIKDKIEIKQWVNSFGYHNEAIKTNADIGIMPLVPNDFNRGKSDLKYLEMAAMGIPAIGSVFTDGTPSPYDVCELKQPDNCTVEDIEKMVDEICEPEKYNDVRDKQYKFMEEQHRWMEDQVYVNKLLSIF